MEQIVNVFTVPYGGLVGFEMSNLEVVSDLSQLYSFLM